MNSVVWVKIAAMEMIAPMRMRERRLERGRSRCTTVPKDIHSVTKCTYMSREEIGERLNNETKKKKRERERYGESDERRICLHAYCGSSNPPMQYHTNTPESHSRLLLLHTTTDVYLF
jgi:hypothetical protein